MNRREFIERIRRYLIENGLTEEDLGREVEGGYRHRSRSQQSQ